MSRLTLLVVIFSLLVQSAQADRVVFKATLTNHNNFEISPGGYVAHKAGLALYDEGSLATTAVKSLCDTGTTPDFLYFIRKEQGDDVKAFSFDGGAKANQSVEAVFEGFTKYPLLSALHKASFTDDTCLGAKNIVLFDAAGTPQTSTTIFRAFDAGVLENLKAKPTGDSLLSQLNPTHWRKKLTEPQAVISASTILTDTMVELKIEPYKK